MFNRDLFKDWEEKGFQRGLEGICVSPPGFYLLPSYCRYAYRLGISKGLSILRKKTMKQNKETTNAKKDRN